MTNNSFYPWHESQWQQLAQKDARLPHAILLHGKSGTGKYQFAEQLSQRLLCDQVTSDLQACQTCPKCVWFQEGAHPDFVELTPEASKTKSGKKNNISVDQVRVLIERLSLTNHSTNGLRVVLVHPAETLNQASANALLKVLEESPVNTLFILVTSHLQKLLPTIISRCQKILLPSPSMADAIGWLNQQGVEQADQWLAYSGGAPLNALALSETGGQDTRLIECLSQGAHLDIFATVTLMTKMQMDAALTLLQKWLYDIVLNYNALQVKYHQVHAKALQSLAKRVNLSKLLQFERTLLQAKQHASHPLNQELQLISLLQQYQAIFK